MLEAGARIDLRDDWIARLYLRAGMTWLDDPSWQREARLDYGLQSGDGYLAHGGGLRLAYRF